MTAPINTMIIARLEKHPDGETLGSETLHGSLSSVCRYLMDFQDGGRTCEVIRLSYDEHGIAEPEIITEHVAIHMAFSLSLADDPCDGIAPDDRPMMHPLIEEHTDFVWTLTPAEREEAEADWRNGMDR